MVSEFVKNKKPSHLLQVTRLLSWQPSYLQKTCGFPSLLFSRFGFISYSKWHSAHLLDTLTIYLSQMKSYNVLPTYWLLKPSKRI